MHIYIHTYVFTHIPCTVHIYRNDTNVQINIYACTWINTQTNRVIHSATHTNIYHTHTSNQFVH